MDTADRMWEEWYSLSLKERERREKEAGGQFNAAYDHFEELEERGDEDR